MLLRAVFSKKKLSADERELFKFLRKAEKLYNKTLEQAWGAEDALNKIVENNNKKVYNKKSEVQTNGEKADQKGTKYSIGERGRYSGDRDNLDNIQGRRWTSEIRSVGKFSKDSEKAGLETRAARQEYLNIQI